MQKWDWSVKWGVKWGVKIEKQKRKKSGLIAKKKQVQTPLLQFSCNNLILIINKINLIQLKPLYL